MTGYEDAIHAHGSMRHPCPRSSPSILLRAAGIFSAAAAAAFLLLFPSNAAAFTGPLYQKNQFPLFIHLNSPRLEGASLEDSFAVSLSHSSVFLYKDWPEWFFGLDMEITEVDFRLKKKIGGSFEAGIELPFIGFSPGFMDGPVNGYHDTFGFPDYGRSLRPDNEFLYDVRRNGRPVIKGEGGRFGLSDVRVAVKKAIVTGDPAISVKAEAELPTGDPERGYGNGETDFGAAILLDKELGRRLKLNFNLGAVFPGDLRAIERVNLRDYYFAGGAVEWAYSGRLGLAAQLLTETSPYPSTGVGAIDRASILFSIGGRYSSGQDNIEFAFTEDPGASGAPDFTFTLTYNRKLHF